MCSIMVRYGLRRDEEDSRDVLVRQTARGEPQDVDLARGESRGPFTTARDAMPGGGEDRSDRFVVEPPCFDVRPEPAGGVCGFDRRPVRPRLFSPRSQTSSPTCSLTECSLRPIAKRWRGRINVVLNAALGRKKAMGMHGRPDFRHYKDEMGYLALLEERSAEPESRIRLSGSKHEPEAGSGALRVPVPRVTIPSRRR
jgi:hypothetical protein